MDLRNTRLFEREEKESHLFYTEYYLISKIQLKENEW